MNSLTNTRRKSGHLANRRRLARKLRRDRKIERLLRQTEVRSTFYHRARQEAIEPLSVYAGKPDHPKGYKLTAFPIVTQPWNGRPMPKWEDLTPWLKTRLLTMACNQWSLQTFNVVTTAELERELELTGKDPRQELRERVRKHLGRVIDRRSEHFFIIEGWSKRNKTQTRIHIHGAAFIDTPEEGKRVVEAIAKACGQTVRGRKRDPRSVHGKIYWRDSPAYANYLFKSVRRPDKRFDCQRLYMSREATGAGREFWGLLTERR